MVGFRDDLQKTIDRVQDVLDSKTGQLNGLEAEVNQLREESGSE
jgi:hypothetical protein